MSGKKKKFPNRDNGKGKKPNYRKGPRDKDVDKDGYRNRPTDKVDKVAENRATSNDPMWWMGADDLTKQLALDATRISTMYAMGAPTISPERTSGPYTPAGIMRLDYIPYFGELSSPTDTINLVAKSIYDIVNSKNSRNPSYDPSDVMIYIIAVGNAWVFHALAKRIVGMFSTFNPLNRYWWRDVLASMGFSAINADQDIVKWRNVANNIAVTLNKLSVPNNIPYFNRAIMMAEGIYMDSPSEKSSLYYFSPAALLRYGYSPDDHTSRLINRTMPWFDDSYLPVTPEVFWDTFTAFVGDLCNDSDINTIASDIIKAFGMENCFRLPYLDESYQIRPVFDPMVNLQVHNARVIHSQNPNDGSYDPYVIRQNMTTNALYTEFDAGPRFGIPDSYYWGVDYDPNCGIPLDFPIDNVPPELVMEATRLIPYGENNPEGHQWKLQGCTEILVSDRIWWYANDNEGHWTLKNASEFVVINPNSSSTQAVGGTPAKLALYSKFHDAPLNFVVSPGSSPKYFLNPSSSHFMPDVTNLTMIKPEDVKKMHAAATWSIFMPRLGMR